MIGGPRGAATSAGPMGRTDKARPLIFLESLVVLLFLPEPADGDWLAVGVVIGLIESAANWHHQSTNGARMLHAAAGPARMLKQLTTGRGPAVLAWPFAPGSCQMIALRAHSGVR